jgi:hypothetical protein
MQKLLPSAEHCANYNLKQAISRIFVSLIIWRVFIFRLEKLRHFRPLKITSQVYKSTNCRIQVFLNFCLLMDESGSRAGPRSGSTQMDPDPEPGGPKSLGFHGSGSRVQKNIPSRSLRSHKTVESRFFLIFLLVD